MKACIYIPPDLAAFLESETARLKALRPDLRITRSAVIQLALETFKAVQNERMKP